MDKATGNACKSYGYPWIIHQLLTSMDAPKGRGGASTFSDDRCAVSGNLGGVLGSMEDNVQQGI